MSTKKAPVHSDAQTVHSPVGPLGPHRAEVQPVRSCETGPHVSSVQSGPGQFRPVQREARSGTGPARTMSTLTQVYSPVEATIEINVLKGPCNISRVAASTPGNFKDHIILYEAAGGPTVIGDGGSVPLSRRVVAVTREQKLALFPVGGDALEYLALTLGHSDEVVNRRMGCAQVEVKVAWTAVPARKRSNMFKAVADRKSVV